MIIEDSDPSVLRVATSAGLQLEFEKAYPYGPDDPHVGGMIVRATGRDVRIEQQVILVESGGPADFLIGLYADFRGWTGERVWRSLEDELRITAQHDGRVHLRWELTHAPYRESPWTFAVGTRHGAGEDIRQLAEAFETLLGRPVGGRSPA
ncbi:DUF6228 family protein [Cellulomonas sp. URHD0024]|uniref:DUF6228 family protein n=1 Tax=Cellulomonas sp. URHD0024 TaxID=1302620 RepID=UPI00041BA42E|nr:DUF6228 family protein [Cellulomonas sp. URHD0024]